ncbi:MAG: hypothetical protein M1817_003808 [Caeruleum heppii]|nr:MAG: hypothetical protein M1817_003808 [Caeruleum heppii]
MKYLFSAALLSLTPLVSAHYSLNYPPMRSQEEETQGEFPCGGHNTPSETRTEWPIAGGAIAIKSSHDQNAIQVLLGLGNDPAPNFNITLLPTIQEQGPGDFCMPMVMVPSDLGITDGQNATIQVVADREAGGGLYTCTDIVFRTSPPPPTSCTNNTGVTVVPYTGASKNANGTDSLAGSPEASGTSAESAASATSGAATPSPSAAATLKGLEWTMTLVVAAAMGFAVML